MKISQAHIEQLRNLLARPAQRFVIVSHTNPDGDAVGSSLAWAEILRGMGHAVTCIVPNKYPYFLDWMEGIDEIVIFKTDTEGRAVRAIEEADAIFCLDFNAVPRLEILSETIQANTTARRVLIDHHLSPDDGFDLALSFPDSSSTCFVVYSIIEALCGTDAITRRMAEALYVGMMTDTGNFTYNSNYPEIYITIAELIKKGIDKDWIYGRIHNTNSENKLRLNGSALSQRMEVFPEQKAAVITLSQEELNRYSYQKGDTEGLVNVPLSMEHILFSAFLREESNLIKISLRSKGSFPANKIASDYFNGGGHLNAAGGEFYGTLQEAHDMMLKILPVIGELATQSQNQ